MKVGKKKGREVTKSSLTKGARGMEERNERGGGEEREWGKGGRKEG